MAALVENMFYVRETPWHGLGVKVEEAPNSADALKLAGLDWEVQPRPIFTDSGIQIPGYVANTRSSDNNILGIVSDKYKIVQNADAFKFTDNIIEGDVRYETAGSLRNGKSVWLLAKLPETKILGDEVAPYLCFSNTHDGTGAVKVFMTPVRVVCNNTLNLAMNTARRTWTCKHMGRIEDKMAEASATLQLANKYMDNLAITADRLANVNITNDEIRAYMQELFPINTEDSDRQQGNMKKAQTDLMACYYMDDLDKFRGTAWGFVNAVADYADHTAPLRNTDTFKERNFERIIVGHPLLDKVFEKFAAKVQA